MMSTTIVLMLGWCASAAAQEVSCLALAQELWKDLSVSVMAMEPEGVRRSVYDRATEVSERCRGDESLAYVRLRAAELGAGSPMNRDQNEVEHRKLAVALSQQFPKSVRIATVRARYELTVDLARKAVSLDPSYAPAQIALASALLDAGDSAAARAAIDRVKDLAKLDDGFAVLARIKWAQEDSAGAVEAANRELKGREAFRLEPGGGDVRAIADAHEVLGLAYLKKGQPEKAAPHLVVAEPTSKRVQDLLKNADPKLCRAVAKSRRASRR